MMARAVQSPLKQRRESLGLTQKEVAKAIQVTNQTVSNWECQLDKPEPKLTVAQFKKLGELLRWEVDDFPDNFRYPTPQD